MKPPFSLSKEHVNQEEFTERVLAKDWQGVLLRYEDKIIKNGHVRQLVAKDIGYGIVEVSKAPIFGIPKK